MEESDIWVKNKWTEPPPKPRPACDKKKRNNFIDGGKGEFVRGQCMKDATVTQFVKDKAEQNVRFQRYEQMLYHLTEMAIDIGVLKPPSMHLSAILMPLFLSKLSEECDLSTWGARTHTQMQLYVRSFVLKDKIKQLFFDKTGPFYNKPTEFKMMADLQPLLYAEVHHIVYAFSLLSEQCMNTVVSVVLNHVFEISGYIAFLADLVHYSKVGKFDYETDDYPIHAQKK
jgi:hypothetical protein